MTQLIQLISGPRNISTAMMYSFGNRADTAIVDEPFYAYYLANFAVDHPGDQDILSSMSSDPFDVIQDVLLADRKEEYLFAKNMAHHMDGYDYSYSFDCRNVFLIRDPSRLIASFAKVITNPVANDVGLRREAEIYNEICSNSKFDPVVIDSGQLLLNPEKVLQELCSQLSIPFEKAMLNWEAGARAEDGTWAKYWYHSVHKSTRFVKTQKTEVTILDDRLVPVYEEVLPYYNQLFEKAIKA
ncbi:MAG: hypothetical protein ACI9P5_002658 [Saprospiraceae bacterium]|jgi:hypothetical protein|tara:strand:+ start:738 stop:1463 length:726 start_codon:yes stop_codon:yes gene_type:complete